MKMRAFIYVILAGVMWGTSGIFVHYLSPYGFSPLQMVAVRGSVSTVCMLLIALLTDRSVFRIKGKELLLFMANGVALFGSAGFYYTAMKMTSVSTAVVLLYTAPIYVAILSVWMFSERLSGSKIVSILFMIVGCGLVSGIVGGAKFEPVGILVGVINGMAYAAYNLITKYAMRKGAHPASTNLYSFIFMSAISLSVSKPWEMPEHISKNPVVTIPLLIALGLVTFIIPFYIYTLGMRALPAATASALGVVEPMAATLFSVMLLGEKLDLFATLGIILILVAVVMLGASDGEKKQKKEKADEKL